jgi:hypothetical protein
VIKEEAKGRSVEWIDSDNGLLMMKCSRPHGSHLRAIFPTENEDAVAFSKRYLSP